MTRRVDFVKCSVDECEKKKSARGWCDKHYRRWLVHGDVTVRRNRRNVDVVLKRNENGEKHCVTCDKWFPEEMFYFRGITVDKRNRIAHHEPIYRAPDQKVRGRPPHNP